MRPLDDSLPRRSAGARRWVYRSGIDQLPLHWLQSEIPGVGRLAQLVEHRLYTPAVRGSSPLPPTSVTVEINDDSRSSGDNSVSFDVSNRKLAIPLRGVVVQLVRTLACHARGRGFESRPPRHLSFISSTT